MGNYDLLDDKLSADPLSVVAMELDTGKTHYRSPTGQSNSFFSLYNPGTNKPQGNFVPTNRYQICIQNGLIQQHPNQKHWKRKQDKFDRNVGLNIRVQPKPPTITQMDTASRGMVKHADKMTHTLNFLYNHYENRKFRESYHRSVVESVFTELMLWLIAEAGILIVLAVGQIYYLRRYFNKKRFL